MRNQIVLTFLLMLMFSLSAHQLFAQSPSNRLKNSTQVREYNANDFGTEHQAFLRQADFSLQQFDFESSLFAFDNAVEYYPQSAMALLKRAVFKKRYGMYNEAAEDVDRARRLNPYIADLYGFNGRMKLLNILAFENYDWNNMPDLDANIKYFYEALDKRLLNEFAPKEELNLIEDLLYQLSLENYRESLTQANKLLEKYPKSYLIHDIKGFILIKMDNASEASRALNEAVSYKPDFALSWYKLGITARMENDYDKADELFQYAVELDPNLSLVYFEKAFLKKKRGDHNGALEEFQALLELDNDYFFEALFWRGMTKKFNGDLSGAILDMDLSISLQPSSAELYKHRANIYTLSEQYFLAINDYTKAIELQENYAEAYYNRGLTYLLLNDPSSACYDLNKSRALGYERATEKLKYFCVD